MQWKFDSGVPIYAQLVEEIRIRIITGAYPPGTRIPAVRELAMEAGVNPNTMQRALQELERTGLLESCRTNGRFVTENLPCIEAARDALAGSHVRVFMRQMQALGYDYPEICAMLEKERSDGHDANFGVS